MKLCTDSLPNDTLGKYARRGRACAAGGCCLPGGCPLIDWKCTGAAAPVLRSLVIDGY